MPSINPQIIFLRFFSLSLAPCPIIVIRSGKIVWKHGPYCWYFRLNLKYLGWKCRAYIKTAKNGGFCGELLSENDFLLLWLWCQRFWGSSEDRRRSKGESQMLLECYSLLNGESISINNSKKRLVTGTPPT